VSAIDPRELLDALLDGELDADEEREVRAWLADDPTGRAELDELTRVRAQLRELPAVDPPVGFFERMLLEGSIEPKAPAAVAVSRDATGDGPAVVHPLAPRRAARRRRAYAGFAGVGVAAAAALILVLGITPVTDRIVPPVNAFAERHDAMISRPGQLPAPGATATTSTTGTPVTTDSSGTTGTSGRPTTTTAAAPGVVVSSDGYRPLPADHVDAMEAPYVAPARLDSYDRRSVYARPGVVHVVYTHGGDWLSMYEQPGTVDWSQLPPNGRMMTVQDDRAWETTIGDQAVLVIDHDGMVVTVVSAAPTDDMMRAATSVPEPAELPMHTRMQRGAAAAVRDFGLG
jgi:negative regulator of sigma E activity